MRRIDHPPLSHESLMTTESKTSSGSASISPELQMLRLTASHLTAQTIHVFATLGIPDILRNSSKTAAELATLTNTDPTVLYRVMRFLSTVDVVTEELDGRFNLTRLGKTLCTRPTSVIHDNTLLVLSRYYWAAIGNLLHTVKTGQNAFQHAYGKGYFDQLGDHPEDAVVFNAAMNSSSQLGISAILAAYDFSGFNDIIDVAGGKGALITGILKKHKSVRGVLFDFAGAIDQLELDPAVADRLTKARGSFFDTIPPGYDAYLMRRILHDWNDENAIKILRHCRSGMRPDSKLLLIELAADSGKTGHDWATMDLLMMLVLSGKERTATEVESILSAAGFRVIRIIRTHSPYWIIESMPI